MQIFKSGHKEEGGKQNRRSLDLLQEGAKQYTGVIVNLITLVLVDEVTAYKLITASSPLKKANMQQG